MVGLTSRVLCFLINAAANDADGTSKVTLIVTPLVGAWEPGNPWEPRCFCTLELLVLGRVVDDISRWWFQIFFYFHPYLGKITNSTNIFQMG